MDRCNNKDRRMVFCTLTPNHIESQGSGPRHNKPKSLKPVVTALLQCSATSVSVTGPWNGCSVLQ